MTSQMERFLTDYLGPTATVPTTQEVRSRIRDCLLKDGIPNVPNAGQMGSPMIIMGTWPWAWAVQTKTITAQEAEPWFKKYLDENREWRNLGTGAPHATPPATVYDAQHYTVTQHLCIGALSLSSATRKEAMLQAIDLRDCILADRVCEPNDEEINQRANGLSLQGLHLDELAFGKTAGVALGMQRITERLAHLHGEKNGVPYYTINTPSATDPRHGYLTMCPWMQADILRGEAQRHRIAPAAIHLDLTLHGLRCARHAQKPSGAFVDDYGWDTDGSPDFYDDGKETMDPRIWPALLDAKDALQDEWPVWAEGMLNGAKDRFMQMNRMKWKDSGFRDQGTMGVAIRCAPSWGWR